MAYLKVLGSRSKHCSELYLRGERKVGKFQCSDIASLKRKAFELCVSKANRLASVSTCAMPSALRLSTPWHKARPYKIRAARHQRVIRITPFNWLLLFTQCFHIFCFLLLFAQTLLCLQKIAWVNWISCLVGPPAFWSWVPVTSCSV